MKATIPVQTEKGKNKQVKRTGTELTTTIAGLREKGKLNSRLGEDHQRKKVNVGGPNPLSARESPPLKGDKAKKGEEEHHPT